MRLVRVVLSGLVVVALASVVPPAGPALAKAPANPEVAQAKRLAASVDNARTPAARVRALTRVMRAAEIGVTTQSGRPLVAPAESGAAAQAHLYDFELKGLAGALARGSSKSFADVARVLATGGFVLAPGRLLPDELIQTSLRNAVRNGRNGARGHLLPLLVAELGARRGRDPSASSAPTTVRLDALQSWLIGADFTIAAMRRIPARGPIRLASAEPARARAATLAADCEKLREAIEKANEEAGNAGKIAKGAAGKVADQAANEVRRNVNKYAVKVVPGWAVRGAWKVGARVKAAADLLPILHGSLLALSVSVTVPRAALDPVHWGHGGPGGMLAFEEKVEMLDDYGDLLVKCGALAGLELPPKGPIAGVTVKWQQAEGDIKQEGSLDCPSAFGAFADKVLLALTGETVCVTKTDKDGIARVRLQTNSEATPAIGQEAENSGLLDGVALYQTAAGGGTTGFIGQFLFPKTGGGTRWKVRSHPCGGVVAANATASAAFAGARASVFAPVACGAIYAMVTAKVSTTDTRSGCPAHTSTSTVVGATNALPQDAPNLDTTVGRGTATGVDISIISPSDAPTQPCEKYSYPFTVPFYFEVSRTGDDQMTLTWGPTAEALAPDPLPPQVFASMNNAAWGGHFPPRDGTYEIDRDTVGKQGSSHQHWSVSIAYSSVPVPPPPAVAVPQS